MCYTHNLSLERRHSRLYYASSRVDNAQKIKSYRHWSALKNVLPHWMFFLFHEQIHEISPGAIQKSNGLKVTCLMSLYFTFEENTMKNEFLAIIFLRIFPDTPPHV